MRLCVLIVAVLCCARDVTAQSVEQYTRKNTFTVFAEYANDSSHILLGNTPNRKIAAFGGQYERRLLDRWGVSLAYVAEFRPILVESDPAATVTSTFVPTTGSPTVSGPNTSVVGLCRAGTVVFSGPLFGPITGSGPVTGPGPVIGSYTDTVVTACSRQSTLAQAGSPFGLSLHFRSHRRVQPLLSGNVGYMFATKPIPVPTAGSFNFTFHFGTGVEYYVAAGRSVRAEYILQHYSNDYTADFNPGVDSQFLRLTYAFGR